MLLCPPMAQAADQRVLPGHVPMEVAKLKVAGRLEGSQRLPLAIALPWRNQPALTNLLAELYNPASPKFHQWLSPEQFTAAFGPTEADYQRVVAFAQAQGLTVTGANGSRMLLDVAGAVSDIERAFHVRLVVYQHPTEARTFYSPDAEPTVDADLPILGVSGLDDYMPPRPMNLVVKHDNAKEVSDATGSGPGGDFVGADLRAAYAPGVSLNGYGQVIGLFEFGPYFPLDVYLYETNAHISTNIVITNVLLDHLTGLAPPGTDDGEETLDIDMAIAMAPGATVVVYEGNSAIDILDRMASDGFAKQLSCSFGYYPPPSGQSQVLQRLAMQGQSFFSSSGDGGAYNSSQTIFSPTDDPNCTSVGGTSLTTSGAGGPWQSETTWRGSGGGISPHYGIPSYQQNISMINNGGSTQQRNIPDVSMLADTVLFWYLKDGQSGTVGGTSASSPMWAGFMALVNQQALANGRGPVGFVNSAAAAIGESSNYTDLFHDITTGNDTNSGSPTAFFAVPGYDLATGWGSPNGPALINYLAAPSNSLLITPGIGFAAVQPYGAPFVATNLSLSLTNTGTASLNWAAGGGPAWLDVSSGGGTLTPGGGPAAVTVSLDATAVSNLLPGVYLANVYFTNQTAGVVEYRLFTLTVSTANFPVAVTGFNDGVIVPANAATGNKEATGFDLANNIACYQAGLNTNSEVSGSGGTQGLPASGVFTSSADGSTVFQFGPYGGNNVLLMGGSYPASGTLSLAAPQSYNTLAVLASSANGGAQGTLVIHFANGTSSSAFNFNAQDWFYTTTNVALSGFGRLDLGSGLYTEDNGSGNPNLYQTAINLAALGSNQPVSSITFTKPAASGDTGVFALSGELMPPPPAIIQQPQPATNNVVGSGSAFGVVAMGAPPLSFQWYGPAGAINGAVNNTLPLPNVQSNQAGSYYVVVTNIFGAITSAVVTLTVYRAPVITRQPAVSNLFLFAGLGGGFSVSGNGALPLNYFWQFNGTNIPGANSPGYALSNAQLTNSGAYAAVLSNSLGAVTSSVVSVSVVAPAPYQQAVLAANPAAYWPLNETNGTVAYDYVAGNNGNYVGAVINKTAGVPNSGMGSPNYAVQLNGSSAYIDVPGSLLDFTTPVSLLAWIKTSGSGNFQTVAGKGDSSYRLDVDGSHDPHFADGPNADVVGPASVAGTVWHQLAGVYDGSMQYLYVDGRLAASGSATGAVSGNSQDFWIGGAPDYGTGRLFLGSVDEVALIPGALTSNQIQQIYLSAGVAPVITQQPLTPWQPNQGATASNFVAALGTLPFSYQWHSPTGAITGATNAILWLTNVQPTQDGNYYVVVSNPNGSTQSSNSSLSVNAGALRLTTNLSPLAITVYAGFRLTYSVTVTGGNPSFQWYQNGATPISGATNATYTFNALLGTNTYRCFITNSLNSVISSTATVIAVPALASLYVQRVLADHPIAF
ncbi:MAG TPA: protease pro-enzyme activation domain-containing protein, partial [Candidatus Acidoferrum sp.]|nr:protease pro-enzyme activation domain-containing protein [Candidatus Acidoferrum sp.]